MENKNGHIAALLTILIWATTFVSTKFLLEDLHPLEILVFRFVIGFLCLCIVYPKKLKTKGRKEEKYFLFAGLTGICFYYLLENIALTYTTSANVGILISTAPFFTALLSFLFYRKQTKITVPFFVGFLFAIIGIACISLQQHSLEINPIGDFLSVLAAFVWAIYSLLIKKISTFQYNTIQTTRRIFFYGILCMIPATFVLPFSYDISPVFLNNNVFHILFLGVGASALCFVTWNYALKILGAIKTSAYIYLVPLVTIIASSILLNESITPTTILGMVFILFGLFLSENKLTWKKVMSIVRSNNQ